MQLLYRTRYRLLPNHILSALYSNISMVMTLHKKDTNLRIARWTLELQNYDYSTEHRLGKRMQHIDTLSRANSILVIGPNTFEFELSVCQTQDPVIKDAFRKGTE